MSSSVQNLKDFYIKSKTEKDILEEKVEELKEKIEEIDIDLLEKSSIVLQKLSEQQRKIACKRMEDLCTFALQCSVSQDLEATIDITKLRHKPAAFLYIRDKKTGVLTSPISGNGGGLVDIIATALVYIIAEVWNNPKIDGPIILDEAYKHLSKEYTPLIAEFLKNISDDFGRQTIISTHNDYIAQAADKRIMVSLDDNKYSAISEDTGGVAL